MKKHFLYFILPIIMQLSSCIPDEVNPNIKDDRNNITGNWTCNENSPTFGEQNYSVNIDKFDSDSTKVEIVNFNGLGAWSSALATMNGLKLNLSEQTVEGYSISGSGTISSNYKTIEWTYEVIELNSKRKTINETVTATYSR